MFPDSLLKSFPLPCNVWSVLSSMNGYLCLEYLIPDSPPGDDSSERVGVDSEGEWVNVDVWLKKDGKSGF